MNIVKNVLLLICICLVLPVVLSSCKEMNSVDSTSSDTDTTADSSVPGYSYRIGSDIPYTDGYEIQTVKEKKTYTFKENSGVRFGLLTNAVSSGEKITLPANNVTGVYTVINTPADSVTEYSFYLKSSEPESEAAWLTCFLGLRLSGVADNPLPHTGVWLALRGKQIGLRTDGWPGTKYVGADWDLSKKEKITVTDDPLTNEIKIQAGDEKRDIALIRIDGKAVSLYLPGEDTPKITDTTAEDIIKGGYMQIWNHHTNTDTVVVDLAVNVDTTVMTVKKDADQIINTRDVFSDTYTAYDDAGRSVVYNGKNPQNVKTGMFYFTWHGYNKGTIYDHTAAYESGGAEALWEEISAGGTGEDYHYWAKPYFGYYRSDDEWVIRKHAAMLVFAGIDFVFVDGTNGLVYEYEKIFDVWSKMRLEGADTPEFCFILQGGNKNELNIIWNEVYKQQRYKDMWFCVNGKPVIMFTTDSNELSSEQKQFFNVRISWANERDKWYQYREGYGCWAWGTMYPQSGGFVKRNDETVLEQMSVMCGFWANGSYGTNAGRSYTSKTGEPKEKSQGDWNMGFGLYPNITGLGLAYQEQFDYAIESGPEIIMITGWNEWIASHWTDPGTSLIAYEYKTTGDKKNLLYFDGVTPEYSRDIEPMATGFKDNYYYQTVMNTRAYKGARPVEGAFGQKTVDINGSAVQWLGVGPEFRDPAGDITHRNSPAVEFGTVYVNESGRNDIVTAKVSSDDEYLYFMAECEEEITAPEGSNWMNLFIEADGKNDNGWYGFDYAINRSRDGGKCSIDKFKDGWNTEKIGNAEYKVSGNMIVIKISRSEIAYNGVSLEFKWADNSVDDGDIMGFLDQGDAAPDARFRYLYTSEQKTADTPAGLTSDMAVFKVNGYNAYINGEQARLVDGSTKATLIVSGGDIYLPQSVLENIGIDCKNEEKFDHYGVAYVKVGAPVAAAGKTITLTKEGLLVIADSEITDDRFLTLLYKTLY